LVAIGGNGSDKGSPVSINDSSWLLERYRCWLVIDSEMLCTLQWLQRTKKIAAKGTRRGRFGHLYDSTKSCGKRETELCVRVERLSSAGVFTKNRRDNNIGNITKGICVTGRTWKQGTPRKIRTVTKRSKKAEGLKYLHCVIL